jgi:NhaP-type Na+/H+ or K+/H+ antiporter
MESDILLGIGLIIVLGVGLQWLARLIHCPSIVLLLAGGLVVGPWLDLVDSDEILGDALFPVVSLAVGILLFLGGLELRFSELGGAIRRPVTALVTVGVLITWVLGTVAVHVLFDQPFRVSVLQAAILVVSGPTVVIPLLRLARPQGAVSTILTWEGIVVDPIGSALTVFCFNAVFVLHFTLGEIWSEFIVVFLAGIAAGLVAVVLLVTALRRLLVPADLEVAVTIMFVVAAYVAAETVRPEAGLFATTTMGVVLANQRRVALRSLRIFGDPILILLIGSLFIVLASRVEPGTIVDHLPAILGLSAFLVMVVRPLVAAVCTIGATSLTVRERAFLACMAPRGIVAAATASFFSLRLQQIGQPSEMLVPVTFAVIIVLALVYGFGARPATRLLRLQRPTPSGLLLVSSSPWAVGLAREMQRAGVPTVLVARGDWDLAGRTDVEFTVFAGLVRDLPDSGLLDDIHHAVVASTDDELNLTAVAVLEEHLGSEHVYLLSSAASIRHDRSERDVEAWTRRPFSSRVSLEDLERITDEAGGVRTVERVAVPPGALVLAVLRPDGGWTTNPGDSPPFGAQVVVALPPAEADSATEAVADADASTLDEQA